MDEVAQDPAPAAPDAPVEPTAPTAPVAPAVLEAQLQFTGQGAEYFRIWVVHTLLTILTLGVYSAWAKVRKARWFAQHTHLLGDAFDFHGKPLRILAGRAVALVLFVAYSHAFDWSLTAGIVAIAVLLFVGPLLFGSAQRFRLANTSWRGLRFGFTAPRARIYAVCVPLVVVWTGGTVWTALQGSVNGTLVIGGVSLLLWPAIHSALKTLQHRHSRFGALGFDFAPSMKAFYGLYARLTGLMVLAALGVGLVGSLLSGVLVAVGVLKVESAVLLGILFGILMVLAIYVMCWPYFAARMQHLVWERTTAGDLRFQSSIRAGKLWKLVVAKMLLVVLTLGFYWPFAVVAIARYRVESLSVRTTGEWPLVIAPNDGNGNAVGDATLDFFDLDLGW